MHLKLIQKKVPVSQFITSIFNLKATFNNNACSGPSIDQTCSFEQSLFQLVRWQNAFNVHFACGTYLVLFAIDFSPMRVHALWSSIPIQSLADRRQLCSAWTTSLLLKALLPMSFEINLLRWLIRVINGTFVSYLIFPILMLCSASNPLLYLIHISMQQTLIFICKCEMWISTERCLDLNLEAKKNSANKS